MNGPVKLAQKISLEARQTIKDFHCLNDSNKLTDLSLNLENINLINYQKS